MTTLTQKTKTISLGVALILALGLTQFGVRRLAMDNSFIVPPPRQYLGLTLDPRVVRRILGLHIIAADLAWVDFMVKSDHNRAQAQFTDLYKAVRNVVALDPDYLYAYYLGGLYLSVITDDVKGATAILREGYTHMQSHSYTWHEAWRIPFTLGYNLIFEEQNFEEGSKYIKEAGDMPNAAPFVKALGERVSTEAGRLELASRVLTNLRKFTRDAEALRRIDRKMLDVAVKQELLDLNTRFEDYLKRSGAFAFKKEKAFREFLRSLTHSGRNIEGHALRLDDLGKIVVQ